MEAELHTTSWANTPDSSYLTARSFKTSTPKMGWQPFIDSLITLGIMDLPTKYNLPQYTDNPHMSTVHVEVAKKNKYRFYSYADINGNLAKDPEARKMRQILLLIESELGFKMLGEI